MKFVNCPQCGRKLLEGENGSSVTVKCNKCKSIVKVNLCADDSVQLNVVSVNGATKPITES